MKMTRSLAAPLLVLCSCAVVLMVSAKSVETSRARRTTAGNCDAVRQSFAHWNVSVATPAKSRGRVCGGECCGEDAEDFLRKQGQKDFATLLRHNSKSLQGLLSFTGAALQNHVSDLSRQSENKTLLLFSQVYKGMAVLSRAPITRLYSDIRNYILVAHNATPPPPPLDIKRSVLQFFTDFFPLVYHHIVLGQNNAPRDFAADYKDCLKKTTESISPFEEIPRDMARSLAKSLEATRLLLHALDIGVEVLNATDGLLVDEGAGKNNAECHQALLKMTHCPKCRGLGKHTKPCSGYCLNVLRGCLTKYVAELDSPWNGYVEGVEGLMNVIRKGSSEPGGSADGVIRNLDSKISDALMKAMQKGQEIDKKVKAICGSPTFHAEPDALMAETPPPPPPTASKPRSTSTRSYSSNSDSHFAHFLTSMAKTRSFYANLADTLCKDESFAEPKDQRCWNGERIAEYTKTVVDAGHGMEKYNPEVKPAPTAQSIDPRVADLVEKLRHVHHMAMSSVVSSGAEVDYMQRDGAEGSGSGSGPDFDDNDDEYNTRGSGSGDRPTHHEDPTDDDGIQVYPPDKGNSRNAPSNPTAGGATVKATVLLVVALAALH